MLTVCVPFWQPNGKEHSFSRCYTKEWVEKLYRGFERNLTRPFKFIVFTDHLRDYDAPIKQELLLHRPIDYGSCIEPYRLNQPMILVGLDTVITGNIDHLADYCLSAKHLAVPLDPYCDGKVCNGVALVPKGHRDVYDAWTGQNDMEWIRIRSEVALLDDLFPGDVVSYKANIKKNGLRDAKIVYFHGKPKMHEIDDQEVLAHWV